jgi:hypothetical protein
VWVNLDRDESVLLVARGIWVVCGPDGVFAAYAPVLPLGCEFTAAAVGKHLARRLFGLALGFVQR